MAIAETKKQIKVEIANNIRQLLEQNILITQGKELLNKLSPGEQTFIVELIVMYRGNKTYLSGQIRSLRTRLMLMAKES